MERTYEDIDLADAHRKEVCALLERYLPGVEAWAYGSRVTNRAKASSDLDIVVFAAADRKEDVSALREAFEESMLPFRVDLFVWDEIPDSFKRTIQQRFVTLQ